MNRRHVSFGSLLVMWGVVCILVQGQAVPTQAVPVKTFSVASIRPNQTGAKQQVGATPNGFRMTNAPFLVAVLNAFSPTTGGDAAYYSNDRVLGAPDWVRAERYDIDARVDAADMAEWQNPASQKVLMPAMLQAMLVERSKLAAHREIKELPIYDLLVSKGGPKLKETVPGADHPSGVTLPGGSILVALNGGRTFQFYNATMSALAQLLSNLSGRPVHDQTGLTGRYDFNIDRAPTMPTDDSGPSIFTAVREQLGLRLVGNKGSVEVLVIDHIERPTSN